MKKFLFAASILLGIFAGSKLPASATLCSIPNTFTAGTPAVAAQVNSNFVALQTCGNNIDHTNIGSGGIYASQIVPDTTAHATFAGSVSYTFSNGLNVTGGFTADTATITSLTASGATVNGTLTVNGPQAFTGTSAGANSSVGLWNDGAGANGLIVNVPTSSNGTRFATNGSLNGGQVTANGQIIGTDGAGKTPAYIAPNYQLSGASVGASIHAIYISTTTASVTSNPCGGMTTSYCSVVTLPAAQAFTAYNTFFCITNAIASGPSIGEFYGAGTTGYGETHGNGSTVIFWSASPSQALFAMCVGT